MDYHSFNTIPVPMGQSPLRMVRKRPHNEKRTELTKSHGQTGTRTCDDLYDTCPSQHSNQLSHKLAHDAD